MKSLRALVSMLPMLLWLALGANGAAAQPVSRIAVRVVVGPEELAPGSELQLRIYGIGGHVLRLPLVHGESWPQYSTHVIQIKLPEALDPRTVQRFSLYYHAANPQSAPWEVTAAEVELQPGADPSPLLLDATLSGSIDRQGELASANREREAMMCASDADCDDGLSCNGRERCAPRSPGADARGCVKGAPVVCPVNQVCVEGRGCRGSLPPGKGPPASP